MLVSERSWDVKIRRYPEVRGRYEANWEDITKEWRPKWASRQRLPEISSPNATIPPPPASLAPPPPSAVQAPPSPMSDVCPDQEEFSIPRPKLIVPAVHTYGIRKRRTGATSRRTGSDETSSSSHQSAKPHHTSCPGRYVRFKKKKLSPNALFFVHNYYS